MKIKSYLILGLISLTVSSCDWSIRTKSLNTKPESESESINNQNQSSNICNNIVTHMFSNIEYPDTFKIWIQGNNLLKSNVHFEIINYCGEMIYSIEFKSNLLLNYGIDSDTTDAAKETFIKQRILTFFNEENFMSPAIKDGEPFDQDYSDKAIWDDINSQKNSIGFYYLIGEEDGRSIAYSKKLKKVVMYFNCC